MISPETIANAGYIVMGIVIFSETGLLAGFFLPGDSLLIAAGLLVANGSLDFVTLNAILIVCAIAGDTTGYLIGSRVGNRLFNKVDGRFIKRRYIEETRAFYNRHGGKAVVLARFIPILRTFIPTLAGVVKMNYKWFMIFNMCGGIFWITSMTFVGYFLGTQFPALASHMEYIIVTVIIISFIPIFWKFVARNKNISDTTIW